MYLLPKSNFLKARLTFNYWRKGGYEIGSEDYRWFVPSVIHLFPAVSNILKGKLFEVNVTQ